MDATTQFNRKLQQDLGPDALQVGGGADNLVKLDSLGGLPAINGASLTGFEKLQVDTNNWNANASNGSITTIVPDYDPTGSALEALDPTVAAQILALTQKVQAIQHALATRVLPTV